MAEAVVSTKFQVVIPKEIRREIGLKSGQVLQVIAKGGVITLVPDQPIARMKGFLRGMKTSALREARASKRSFLARAGDLVVRGPADLSTSKRRFEGYGR